MLLSSIQLFLSAPRHLQGFLRQMSAVFQFYGLPAFDPKAGDKFVLSLEEVLNLLPDRWTLLKADQEIFWAKVNKPLLTN